MLPLMICTGVEVPRGRSDGPRSASAPSSAQQQVQSPTIQQGFHSASPTHTVSPDSQQQPSHFASQASKLCAQMDAMVAQMDTFYLTENQRLKKENEACQNKLLQQQTKYDEMEQKVRDSYEKLSAMETKVAMADQRAKDAEFKACHIANESENMRLNMEQRAGEAEKMFQILSQRAIEAEATAARLQKEMDDYKAAQKKTLEDVFETLKKSI